ncbi:hypothetical protein [Enterococcus sp. N249-2]
MTSFKSNHSPVPKKAIFFHIAFIVSLILPWSFNSNLDTFSIEVLNGISLISSSLMYMGLFCLYEFIIVGSFITNNNQIIILAFTIHVLFISFQFFLLISQTINMIQIFRLYGLLIAIVGNMGVFVHLSAGMLNKK